MTTTPGVFILALDQVSDLLNTDKPRVIKCWASTGPFWAQYKALVPDAYIIARQYWRHEVEVSLLEQTDSVLCYRLLAGLEQSAGRSFGAWLGPNEYISQAHDTVAWERAIKVEKAFAAAAHEAGADYWALSMSTHNLPPQWVVEELARDPNITGLSLHLYSLERPMQVEPEVERYKAFIATCPLPVLIGETGRDGIGRNIGWQQQGVSAPDFAEEMRWLTENLGAWAYTIFTMGGTDDWKQRGFETKDNAEFRDLIWTFDYSGFTPPERKEKPVAVYTFPQGFDVYAEGNPQVGRPAGKPRYDDDGNLRQLTENGELIGLKEFNWKVNFFAAAPRKGLPIV